MLQLLIIVIIIIIIIIYYDDDYYYFHLYALLFYETSLFNKNLFCRISNVKKYFYILEKEYLLEKEFLYFGSLKNAPHFLNLFFNNKKQQLKWNTIKFHT